VSSFYLGTAGDGIRQTLFFAARLGRESAIGPVVARAEDGLEPPPALRARAPSATTV